MLFVIITNRISDNKQVFSRICLYLRLIMWGKLCAAADPHCYYTFPHMINLKICHILKFSCFFGFFCFLNITSSTSP